MNPTPIFAITDGQTRINIRFVDPASLSDDHSGIKFYDWQERTAEPKAGGVWASNPFSWGSRLVMKEWENITNLINLVVSGDDQDTLVYETQELRRLLEKAVAYWVTEWQDEPVWIEARGTCETNIRYALVKDYRLPQDGNRYSEPFNVIEDFPITLVHTFWMSSAPGDGECLNTSGQKANPFPYAVEYNATTTSLKITSAAAIEDLPIAANGFTAEAWIRADGRGENNNGRIFDKTGGAALGWFFAINSIGLTATVYTNGVDAVSTCASYEFPIDGEWHHVAMTYRDTGDRKIRFFVDGVQVTQYSTQTAGTGVYDTDRGDVDLYIGNRSATDRTFDGAIGWTRLSNTLRTITSPWLPRCLLPIPDANTNGQWIREGSGSVAYDQTTNANNGDIANHTWSECDGLVGQEANCEDYTFFANHSNRAQLTHIFQSDGGVFTNLLGAALPYRLLPAVLAVGDAVYFGIETLGPQSGPFSSLVFDITTPVTGTITLIWEYYNGAWAALTVQDNTNQGGAHGGDAFDTAGVNSVHWQVPSDWVTIAVNGVVGYWVRCRVSATAAGTGPFQGNRDPYTITWPYIELASEDVKGDLPALVRMLIDNASSRYGAFIDLWVNRIVMGLRSLSRGADFSAWLNFSDEQNPAGVTTSISIGAYSNQVTSVTGRRYAYTPAGVQALLPIYTFNIIDSYTAQYKGIYRVFLRGQAAVAPTNVDLYLRTMIGNQYPVYVGPLQFPNTNATQVLDFGIIPLLPDAMKTGEATIICGIRIEAEAFGAATIYLHDLILIPVDEWAGDFSSFTPTQDEYCGRFDATTKYNLDIDAVYHPKMESRALTRAFYTNNYVVNIWQQIINNPPMVQANADQKLWTFMTRNESTNQKRSPHEIANRVGTDHVSRYFASRGNR